MKIIFLQDIPKVGRKYEIKDVNAGYARNFLISRGLAEIATSKNITNIEKGRRQAGAEKKIQEDLFEKNIEALNGAVVVMKKKANEQGHLFAGVHKEEVAAELKKQDHIDMPAEYIQLEHPIKELGEFDIEVKFTPPGEVKDKTATFKLKIAAV